MELTAHGPNLARALGRLPWVSDEITLAEKGTERQLLSGFERDRLGPIAEWFPLFT